MASMNGGMQSRLQLSVLGRSLLRELLQHSFSTSESGITSWERVVKFIASYNSSELDYSIQSTYPVKYGRGEYAPNCPNCSIVQENHELLNNVFVQSLGVGAAVYLILKALGWSIEAILRILESFSRWYRFSAIGWAEEAAIAAGIIYLMVAGIMSSRSSK